MTKNVTHSTIFSLTNCDQVHLMNSDLPYSRTEVNRLARLPWNLEHMTPKVKAFVLANRGHKVPKYCVGTDSGHSLLTSWQIHGKTVRHLWKIIMINITIMIKIIMMMMIIIVIGPLIIQFVI